MGAGASHQQTSTNLLPFLSQDQNLSSNETIELIPGLVVRSGEANDLLARIFRDGHVSPSLLQQSLEREGISATIEETREMIRLLNPCLNPEYCERADVLEVLNPFSIDSELNDRMWRAFLNNAFHVGEKLCTNKIIEISTVASREAYVYLSLPSLTFLDMILFALRSDEVDYFFFDSDLKVKPDAELPIDWREIICILIEVQIFLKISEETDWSLRGRLQLSLASDPNDGCTFTSSDVVLARLHGGLQNAALRLSQLSRFQETFEDVFVLIQETCENKDTGL
jgi:hypothetical protein